MINNKYEQGYYNLFQKIKKIVSIDHTKTLNLRSYTCDFEKALIKALNKTFENIRRVGCFYH